jgi:sulfur carrier protein
LSDSVADPVTVPVTVNGQACAVPAGCDVGRLLRRLCLDTRKVAVERNEAIVPRSLYAQTILQAGDSLEIVHFIGGG